MADRERIHQGTLSSLPLDKNDDKQFFLYDEHSPHSSESPPLLHEDILRDIYESSSDEVPLLSSSDNYFPPNIHSSASPTSYQRMDHCHEVSNQRLTDLRSAKRKLITACVLCLIFVGSEVVGGLISGSLAILTDAAHMFSDFASFIVGLLVIHLGNKAAKKNYNFGFLRAEALGALFTVTVIWYVTGILLYLAIERLSSQNFEVEPDAMMITGGIAVIFNLILGYIFHGHSHGKAEEGSHSHVHINIRAAFIHVLGDLVQSIGVFISSIIIKIWPEYKIADPICTVLFSVIVFCTTLSILRDTLRILMEGVPSNVSYDQIMRDMLDTSSNIVQVHDLCIWSLTTDKLALMAHVAVNPSNREQDESIVKELSKNLRIKYPHLSKITIQVEDYMPIMSTCGFCQSLE